MTLTVTAVKPGLISADQQTACCLLDSPLILQGFVTDMPRVIVIHVLRGHRRTVCIPLAMPPPHTNLTLLFPSPHN